MRAELAIQLGHGAAPDGQVRRPPIDLVPHERAVSESACTVGSRGLGHQYDAPQACQRLGRHRRADHYP
jgi:hypothetical protein